MTDALRRDPIATISPEANAGQAVYTTATLRTYDLVVLGLSNQLVWRCPSRHLRDLYDRSITANHLDVGVGTGYFLRHGRVPSVSRRIALMDLNPNCLNAASAALAPHRPETYRCNVLEPISLAMEPFDSIGLNYLLHCLPGGMARKAVVFDHLKPLMRPGACLFGSTLLQGDRVPRSWGARRLMEAYNARGIFSNRQDTLGTLQQELERRFRQVTVELRGCVALFTARDGT